MLAHYARDYPALVDNLLSKMSEPEAMARAVGSQIDSFRRIGALERQILIQAGLQRTHTVVDVGCGSGRLASALVDDHEGPYRGFDVVEKMIEYARRTFVRDNFQFDTCGGLKIAMESESADFITFFSVFTHLQLEESYLYLQDARRVLRPGGHVVCSFLDFDHNWDVFEATALGRAAGSLPHLNIFLSPRMLERLFVAAGFEIVSTFRGKDRFISLPDGLEIPGELPLGAGTHAFGQGVCIARKPL